MRKATFINGRKPIEHRNVQPIVEALARLGIEISPRDAYEAWNEYSDSMAAGWLIYPDTDEQFLSCIDYYVSIEDEPVCEACDKGWGTGHTCKWGCRE